MIGDVLLVLEKSGDGRCKGMIGEREGWFPGDCTRGRMYDCCTESDVSHVCTLLCIESMLSL